MVSIKDRRHSGRRTLKIYNPKKEPYECVYWDDWNDHRDGFRNPIDKTKIRDESIYCADRLEIKKYNEKNKRLLKIREARKWR